MMRKMVCMCAFGGLAFAVVVLVGGLAGGKLLGDLGIGFHEGTRNLER